MSGRLGPVVPRHPVRSPASAAKTPTPASAHQSCLPLRDAPKQYVSAAGAPTTATMQAKTLSISMRFS